MSHRPATSARPRLSEVTARRHLHSKISLRKRIKTNSGHRACLPKGAPAPGRSGGSASRPRPGAGSGGGAAAAAVAGEAAAAAVWAVRPAMTAAVRLPPSLAPLPAPSRSWRALCGAPPSPVCLADALLLAILVATTTGLPEPGKAAPCRKRRRAAAPPPAVGPGLAVACGTWQPCQAQAARWWWPPGRRGVGRRPGTLTTGGREGAGGGGGVSWWLGDTAAAAAAAPRRLVNSLRLPAHRPRRLRRGAGGRGAAAPGQLRAALCALLTGCQV